MTGIKSSVSIDFSQVVPGGLDRFEIRHVGHAASGRQVGKVDLDFVAGKDVGRLGHEVDAAKDDRPAITALGSEPAQPVTVSPQVRELDHVVLLVMVSQNQERSRPSAVSQRRFSFPARCRPVRGRDQNSIIGSGVTIGRVVVWLITMAMLRGGEAAQRRPDATVNVVRLAAASTLAVPGLDLPRIIPLRRAMTSGRSSRTRTGAFTAPIINPCTQVGPVDVGDDQLNSDAWSERRWVPS